MNNPPSHLHGSPSTVLTLRSREKGVALIVVLSCLLLVVGLVLSFFLSVSTEVKASKMTESAGRSRDLVDTAVNVVMAQIREATTRGPGVAWASQPGMIRTYGSAEGEASADPLAYYKLYSAQGLVWNPTPGGPEFSPDSEVPANWHETPSLFADLNLPVLTLDGTRQYPIADPAAGEAVGSVPAVKGFSVSGAPLAGSEVTDNPLPMPVRWLYVLEDGRVTVPTSGDATTAVWTGGVGVKPTVDNPIIGRVAFWTDDESCKVNINTAAGDVWVDNISGNDPPPGSFWDVPRLNTLFAKERLARRQVGQFEYQRYPGHPATTYLSAVFPNLTRAGIGNVVSRIQEGGSRGGTAIATGLIELDDDRLYATVDEFLYDPVRESQEGNGISREELLRSRFFISANSRAPETNLFNQPRVAIWPLHVNDSPDYRTAFDRLISFCSTANGSQYGVLRENAYSPTADYELIARNREVYGYLQRLTGRNVPGFGGSFAGKYPQDRNQILTQIFDYVRSTNLFDDTLEPQDQNNVDSWTFPTRGNQFTSPRTRSTDSNKRMGGRPGHGQVAPLYIEANDTMGFGRFNTISEVGLHFICTADGSGDPAMSPSTEENNAKLASNHVDNRTLAGMTLNADQIRVEAMFLMELFSVAQGWNALNQDFQIRVTGLDGLRLRGRGDGGAQPLGFPASGTIHINAQPFAHTRTVGGSNGFRVTLADRGVPERAMPSGGVLAGDSYSTNLANTYPFVSAPITIEPGAEQEMFLDYVGNEPIRVEIYAQKYSTIPNYSPGYAPPAESLVQTIELDFLPAEVASVAFPSPKLVFSGHAETFAGNVEFESTRENFWTFARTPASAGKLGRLAYIKRPPFRTDRQNIGGLFRDRDTLRTLVPVHGDYRHVAAQRNVPVEVFVPHQYYASATQVAHSFTEGLRSHNLLYNSTREGKLAPLSATQNYHENYSPDVPFRDPPWGSDSGDWDHGTGLAPDGAYINKPDEGHNASGSVPYFANDYDHEASGPTFFSPNRLVMSAGVFGSLPTQIKAGKTVEERAWRTLLFRPDPSKNGFLHVGGQSPKDHLLLDLFWMPVVEPYAISEPFSTAGRINMNYQLMPFTYIKRSTGLRALLQSERVAAVPLTAVGAYKSGTSINYQYLIDDDATLDQFEARFAENEIFRSATEICDVYLVPKGVPGYSNLTASSMPGFWAVHALTGDNLRERPYATLYPRLTTKSNTYTVHYQVQTLRQASRSRGNDATAWASWDSKRDEVLSEIRGSTMLERYVDPQDPGLPDFAASGTVATLDDFYRFRVLSTSLFLP